MEARGLVEGLEITKKETYGNCVDCLMGKAVRHPFDTEVDVKKGILLQLFGGTNKSIARGGGGGGPRYRGDINVLLVGDPGVSKSQILQVIFLPLRSTIFSN